MTTPTTTRSAGSMTRDGKRTAGAKSPRRDLQRIHARLDELADALAEVRGRVAEIEFHLGTPPGEPDGPALDLGDASGTDRPRVDTGFVTLLGRTLMVLAGAYLFRALSDAQIVPVLVGVGAGLTYAAWWLVMCDRAAAAGHRLSAVFHGLATAMMGFPLIFETTARFQVLTPVAGSTALVMFVGLGLTVAARRHLPEVGWTFSLCAVSTATGVLVGTHHVLPVATALLLHAGIAEGFALFDRRPDPRLPVALGLGGVSLLMAALVTREGGLPAGYAPFSPGAAYAFQVMLPALYLASIAARTLLRGRRVTGPDVVLCSLALLVGLSGVVRITTHEGASLIPLGIVTLLLGAAAYALSFSWIDRRVGRGRNFYFYTTLAAALVLVGSNSLLDGAALALAWLLLAVTVATLGRHFDRATLRFQGAGYWTAAAIVAGVPGAAATSLLAAANMPWPELNPAALFVGLGGILCYTILADTREARWAPLIPRAAVAALTAWGLAGLAARWLALGLAGAGTEQADVGLVATGRTAVLAAAAAALAWVGRRQNLPELRWCVYPLLAGGALKLLAEDLASGRPLTLFLSLACYGAALLAVPWLLRKESPTRPG